MNLPLSTAFTVSHRFCREGNGTPLQYSCLENPWTEEPGRLQSMGWLRVRHDWATSLSLFTFHFHALEKEMATQSSILAWRIPGTGKPGGLPSLGSHRVRHDWSDLAAAAAQVLGCCVFIFICFYAYFDFFFDFFCDLLVIQQCVVQPPYVGIFNSFSSVIEI